jgi:hypothetical protein
MRFCAATMWQGKGLESLYEAMKSLYAELIKVYMAMIRQSNGLKSVYEAVKSLSTVLMKVYEVPLR